MKPWSWALAWLLLLPMVGWGATSVTMDGPMTDSNAAVGQAYQKRFNLNLDDHNIDYGVVQVIYASGTYADSTFNDGQSAAATFTVGSFAALSTAAATGQLTMVSTTAAAGTAGSATVVFGNNTAGAQVSITGPPGGLNYEIGGTVSLGFVSSNTASNFATAVNVSSNTSGITATQSGTSAIVTLSCLNTGTFCNNYAVTSTSAAEVSTAAFSGGVNPVRVTIGGYVYRAVADFAVGASTAAMAVNLDNLISASSNTTGVDANAAATCAAGNCGVVYTTATTTGSAGNVTFNTSNALAISTSATTMTGGQDNAVACINNICVTANKDWYPVTSNAQTATNLASAFNTAASSLVITAAAAGSIVSATSTIVGPTGDYAIRTSTQNNLTIAPYTSSSVVTGGASGFMTGGTASSYTINTQSIRIVNHGYPTALKVSISSTTGNVGLSYSTASVGGTPVALGFGTTWYVIPVDANTIQLSQTSTGAVAGSAVTLVSSRALTTADVWTIHVATASGPTSYGFYESNDGTNFWSVGSSVTIADTVSFVNPSTFTYLDFGNIDAKWLQLNVSPPSIAGAVSVKAIMHGEKR